MRQFILKACLYGVIIMGFVIPDNKQDSSITGKLSPADAAESVWAIMGKDSVNTSPGNDGNFQLKTKPGTWKLFVLAKAPYKNTGLETVEVTAGNTTDVGEIKLQKAEK